MMKKAIILCVSMVMMVSFIALAVGEEYRHETLKSLKKLYEYDAGVMVSLYDAVYDYRIYFSGGKEIRTTFADNPEINVSIDIYDETTGELLFSLDPTTGNKTYYIDGDKSKPDKIVNREGTELVNWEYDSSGFMIQKNVYGSVEIDGEMQWKVIAETIYKDGLEVENYEYDYTDSGVGTRRLASRNVYEGRQKVGTIIFVTDEDGQPVESEYIKYEAGRISKVMVKDEETGQWQTVKQYVYENEKLVCVETLNESGDVIEKTFFDEHGRQDKRETLDPAGTDWVLTEEWFYNDTGAEVYTDIEYEDPDNPGEMITVTIVTQPGGLSVSAVYLYEDNGECLDCEITYYNWNQIKCSNGPVSVDLLDEYRSS